MPKISDKVASYFLDWRYRHAHSRFVKYPTDLQVITKLTTMRLNAKLQNGYKANLK